LQRVSRARGGPSASLRISPVGLDARKADHMEEVGAAESPPVLLTQLSTQRVDNLLAVGCSLGHEDGLFGPSRQSSSKVSPSPN